MKIKMFDNDINYNKIKDGITNNLDKIMGCSNDRLLRSGLESLNKVNDSKRLISIAKKIDKQYDYYNRKIPILLCSSIILDKYSMYNLSDINIISIADISSLYDSKFLDKYINIFNQELLDELRNKTTNYDEFYGYMFMIEEKYDELVKNNEEDINLKLIMYSKSITDIDYKKHVNDTKNSIEDFSKGGVKF